VNPNYYANITADTYCEMKDKGVKYTETLAFLGRQGCDPPPNLFERFLIRLSKVEKDVDILFMPGDFIGHSIPVPATGIFDQKKYDELFSVHEMISDLLAIHLPNVLIVPAYGNNDWLFHY